MNIIVILLVFLLLTGLYALLLGRAAFPRLRLSRSFSRAAAFAGEEIEMVETVDNASLLPFAFLQLECRIPSALRFRSAAEEEAGEDRYHQSLFMLAPRRRVIRHYRLTLAQRGIYQINTATLTAGDLCGLYHRTRELTLPARVVVWPRPCGELPLPLSRLIGQWVALRALSPDPFLYRGLRPYRPGDPLRDVHWPASARSGEMQVMVRETTASARLLILLNGQAGPRQWQHYSIDEAETVERLISLAASACCHALKAGLPVGFAVNMADESGQSALLWPDTCGMDEERLLTGLAAIRMKQTYSLHRFVELLSGDAALGGWAETDVLLLTAYENEETAQVMDTLRALCRSASLYCTGEGGLAA